MKHGLTGLVGGMVMAGALIGGAAPAEAQAWRYEHPGYGYHHPVPHAPGYWRPAYRPYGHGYRPAYFPRPYGWRAGYRHPGFRAYRPCNSWWHWNGYRNVRVTNC